MLEENKSGNFLQGETVGHLPSITSLYQVITSPLHQLPLDTHTHTFNKPPPPTSMLQTTTRAQHNVLKS